MILLGLFMIRFLFHLPGPTRTLFILAAVFFVSGALGVEMIGSKYVFEHGPRTVSYGLIATLEEFLEMVGTLLFINALLACVTDSVEEVRVLTSPKRPTP